MNKKVFEQIRLIVYEKAGISLNDGKDTLVSARLAKRMRALDIETHEEYLEKLLHGPSGEEIVNLLDVISTNVTSFFRESEHFDFLAKKFSEWIDKGQRRFRFWSSACSSGEEPFTLAMSLLDVPYSIQTDIKILATDISTKVLEKCRAGIYCEDKVKSVAPHLREKNFTIHKKDGVKLYEVSPKLREMVVFQRMNLSIVPFQMQGPMDAVFCRNVMIYFDNEVRKKLLTEIYRLLKPGGFLFVGHAESLTGMISGLKPVKPSIYIKT